MAEELLQSQLVLDREKQEKQLAEIKKRIARLKRKNI